MALKTGISTLALGALLFSSTTVLAQDFNGQQGWHDADAPSQQWNDDHGVERNHGPIPPPPAHERGRYELQTVQRWVPGHSERVWVPEQCRTGRWGRSHCQAGYYEQQWVAGRYEQLQEWVWVRAPRWGGHRASPATYYP
jgi:hypothetical protein